MQLVAPTANTERMFVLDPASHRTVLARHLDDMTSTPRRPQSAGGTRAIDFETARCLCNANQRWFHIRADIPPRPMVSPFKSAVHQSRPKGERHCARSRSVSKPMAAVPLGSAAQSIKKAPVLAIAAQLHKSISARRGHESRGADV